MSFEVFLQCFDRGEPAGIDREAIRALFPVDNERSDGTLWSVWYDQQNGCDIFVEPLESDPSLVTALTVSRPCEDRRLWEALLAVMRMGAVTLYFPGEAPPLVAGAQVAHHLPPDMVETMGPPAIAATAQDILDAIRDA